MMSQLKMSHLKWVHLPIMKNILTLIGLDEHFSINTNIQKLLYYLLRIPSDNILKNTFIPPPRVATSTTLSNILILHRSFVLPGIGMPIPEKFLEQDYPLLKYWAPQARIFSRKLSYTPSKPVSSGTTR